MNFLTVAVRRLRSTADPLPLPQYMTVGAAGMDLMADIGKPVVLAIGARQLIQAGIAVAIPPGYEAQIRPRSGLALKHGVTLLNSPGTIDSDYRGEIQVLVINLGSEPYTIRRGDRIAQLIIASVVRAEWHEVDDLAPSRRGPGGFGHTGVD